MNKDNIKSFNECQSKVCTYICDSKNYSDEILINNFLEFNDSKLFMGKRLDEWPSFILCQYPSKIYDILKENKNIEIDFIKNQYRELSVKWHPKYPEFETLNCIYELKIRNIGKYNFNEKHLFLVGLNAKIPSIQYEEFHGWRSPWIGFDNIVPQIDVFRMWTILCRGESKLRSIYKKKNIPDYLREELSFNKYSFRDDIVFIEEV